MEKASEKIDSVVITLSDGTKRTLATIKPEELPLVTLDGKPATKGGTDYTSVTLKRGIVSDDGNVYVERRLFRYAPSKADPTPKTTMWDCSLPLTEAELNKSPFTLRLDYFWKSARVEGDHQAASGEGVSPQARALGKAVAQASPETQAKIAELLAASGLSVADLESAKTAMKAAGFGKGRK